LLRCIPETAALRAGKRRVPWEIAALRARVGDGALGLDGAAKTEVR
jgi:hypothetical protein